MDTLIGLIVGAIVGFTVHSISMNVSFKQRTLENKIKVYDALISHWVSMRNFIYAHRPFENTVFHEVIAQFDQMYGNSQTFIGEVFLICENISLATRINELNEKFYRTNWHQLKIEDANATMEFIKVEAIALISEMRSDIKESTRFDKNDFLYMLSGFWKRRKDS